MPRLRTGMRSTETPPMVISPLSGSTNPAMARSRVVLPLPLGPSSEKNEPSAKSSETSSSARGLAEALGEAAGLDRAHRSPPNRAKRANSNNTPMETTMTTVEMALTSGVKPLRIAE